MKHYLKIKSIIGCLAPISLLIGLGLFIISIYKITSDEGASDGYARLAGYLIGISIISTLVWFVLSLFTKSFWQGVGEAAQNGQLLRGAIGRCPECRLKVSGFAKKCPHCTSDISSSSYIK